jgi:hypothetical protein
MVGQYQGLGTGSDTGRNVYDQGGIFHRMSRPQYSIEYRKISYRILRQGISKNISAEPSVAQRACRNDHDRASTYDGLVCLFFLGPGVWTEQCFPKLRHRSHCGPPGDWLRMQRVFAAAQGAQAAPHLALRLVFDLLSISIRICDHPVFAVTSTLSRLCEHATSVRCECRTECEDHVALR